jgi:predicted transcriptional regulator of viral defense system
METLKTFTHDLLSHGKNFFSKQEALLSLGISESQFRYQAYRLSKKKIIRRLVRDFFMIIPVEYQALGSLPPHWIVNALMHYLGRKYYIGLLSAASLYGATEQQPMTFQVIVDKKVKKIKLPRGTIDFHVKRNCELSAIDRISTPVGYANISTKEQTIVDLVHYYEISGGLSNVTLIIKDLGAECRPQALEQVIGKEKNNAMLQRLGYLLELTNHHALANIVELQLATRSLFYVPLRPDTPERTGKRLARWKLILNDYVELS